MVILLFTIRQWLFHKWVLAYILALVATNIFITYAAFFGLGWVQPEFYGRVAVSVVNASIFLVSLTSLILGFFIYQEDREGGLYEWFISRPVIRSSYLLQRWLGLAASLGISAAVAFAASAVAVWLLTTVFLTQVIAIGAVMVMLTLSLSALGFLLSQFTSDKVAALGAGFFLWLYLNFVHGLIAFVLALFLPAPQIFLFVVTSPVESARFLSFYAVDPTLSFINPVTAYDVSTSLGSAILTVPLIILLAPPILLFIYISLEKLTTK
ncbi:MAG: ABC transporter permease subunit [Pyrobaculum sp.]